VDAGRHRRALRDRRGDAVAVAVRWQFEIPTEEQAREQLKGRSYQDTMFKDAVSAQRRLMPVTTPQELAANKAWLEEQRRAK